MLRRRRSSTRSSGSPRSSSTVGSSARWSRRSTPPTRERHTSCDARGRTLSGLLAIDHVIVPVHDLDVAGRIPEFEAKHRATTVEGGRHPAWGTANRIIPLGDTYLELVAVEDRETAGRSCLRAMDRFCHPRTAARLGRSNGRDRRGRTKARPARRCRVLGWHPEERSSAGAASVSTSQCVSPDSRSSSSGEMASPCLEPPRSTIRAASARLKSLSVAANQENLAAWLGDNDLPIIVIGPSGTPAVTLTRGPDDFTLE